jgi:hypothetical protein
MPWYRVVGRTATTDFTAALRVRGGHVVETAPLLGWMLGRCDRSLTWLRAECQRRGWRLEPLPDPPEPPVSRETPPAVTGTAARSARSR